MFIVINLNIQENNVMPMNSTQLNFRGRLGSNPKSYVTGNDSIVAGVSIAIDDDRKDKTGEWIDNTMWLWTEAWGKLSTRLMDARKGDEVFISGKIKQSRFIPEGEEKEVTVTKVWADSIQIIRRTKAKSEEQSTAKENTDAQNAMNNAATQKPYEEDLEPAFQSEEPGMSEVPF